MWNGDGEGDVHEPEQSSMGVCQRPHQPARLVADIEIESHLETVESFEPEAHGGEQKNPNPTELQMKPVSSSLSFFRMDLV